MRASHDDIREMSIAIESTSAILLTILVAAHVSYTPPVLHTVPLAVFSLYFALGFGGILFMFIAIKTTERKRREIRVTEKLELVLFFLQLAFFIIGTIGVSVVLLYTLL
jgi:uncharacterized membrane protein